MLDLRVTTAALAVLLCTACDGKNAEAPPASANAAEGKAAAEDEAAETKAAEPTASEPASSEAPPAADADPLGARFQDPPWFRRTLFGDQGKDVDFARSEANEAGLFKSHIVFEMADGVTLDDCVSLTTEKLKSAVELTPQDTPDGRVQLTGTADRYGVTAMCGEAEGKMRAYVAYEWTR